jgi:hypothetical protein
LKQRMLRMVHRRSVVIRKWTALRQWKWEVFSELKVHVVNTFSPIVL